MFTPRSAALTAFLAAACVLAASPLLPPTRPPLPGGACAFQPIDPAKWGNQDFQNPPDVRSVNGRLTATLIVGYTDPARTTIAGCHVTLRTYNGALVGPTLRAKPGDVMSILLDNRLPVEPPALVAEQLEQESSQAFIDTEPHSFNTTNLHTHGLHVSPVGNSDNVLLAIQPQTKLQYQIALPPDHPVGAYWYHAHGHGSTAIQVGSGMEGAIIIEDDSLRIPAALREANKHDKVMNIQTILYDTAGKANNIAAFFPDNPQTDTMCMKGNPGCTWQNSNRRTTINGQVVPVIHMQPGEVQRWRLIDAGFRESIEFNVEGHPLYEIATDGVYMGRIDKWAAGQPIDLEPGYRSDVLIKASNTPGTYRIFDAATPARRSLRAGVAENTEVIALLRIAGAPFNMALPTSAEMAPLAPFGKTNLQATADGTQHALFWIGGSPDTLDQRAYFQINYSAFNPSRIRYLQLGATEQWVLSTVGSPHVFHIHVNPFQVGRTAPDGTQETVWKDTQLIPADSTINMYTHYTDFIGQFVIHCHILDHEDLGMMEVVEVIGANPSTPRTSTSMKASPAGGMQPHNR